MLVAISPIKPDKGNIKVQIYKATVIGIKPIGFLRAFKISSSTFDSVLSANLPKAFKTTDIIKPLNRSAVSITNKDEIIEPRSIPRNPVDQTSDNKSKKSFIIYSRLSIF